MTRPRRICRSLFEFAGSMAWLVVVCIGLVCIVCFWAVVGVVAEVFET